MLDKAPLAGRGAGPPPLASTASVAISLHPGRRHQLRPPVGPEAAGTPRGVGPGPPPGGGALACPRPAICGGPVSSSNRGRCSSQWSGVAGQSFFTDWGGVFGLTPSAGSRPHMPERKDVVAETGLCSVGTDLHPSAMRLPSRSCAPSGCHPGSRAWADLGSSPSSATSFQFFSPQRISHGRCERSRGPSGGGPAPLCGDAQRGHSALLLPELSMSCSGSGTGPGSLLNLISYTKNEGAGAGT